MTNDAGRGRPPRASVRVNQAPPRRARNVPHIHLLARARSHTRSSRAHLARNASEPTDRRLFPSVAVHPWDWAGVRLPGEDRNRWTAVLSRTDQTQSGGMVRGAVFRAPVGGDASWTDGRSPTLDRSVGIYAGYF